MASADDCSQLLQQLAEGAVNVTFEVNLYLQCMFGPPRMEAALTLTCLYSFLLISGLVGNTATLLSIVRNKHLQTPTNCYL
jgi:hypothetical protein